MISDEIRELLSAYVDGELRDADAARVEELSKRDPALRREIEAYRTLRGKLRDWDAAEHGGPPPATLAQRVLARVRAVTGAEREAARGRVVAVLFHPVSLAAALLLATATGLWAARSNPVTPEPAFAQGEALDGGGVKLAPPPAGESYALPGSALVAAGDADEAPAAAPRRWRLTDEFMTLKALELKKEFEREDERIERLRARIVEQGERRTVAVSNPAVAAMVRGYAGVGEPLEGLVLVNHARVLSELQPVHAVPAGSRIAVDLQTEKSIYFDKTEGPVLSPLGEVWTAVQDGSGRTRLVTGTNWLYDSSQFVPVAWADEIEIPASRSNLEVQDFIVGPRARRRLLEARGQDAAFLLWLRHECGGRNLLDAFAVGAREREKRVQVLVRALAADPTATGFAVLAADGRPLGVELFQGHDLMMEFAARLLRGYLFEEGEKGVSVSVPKAGRKGPGVELVTLLLEGLPEKAPRYEEVQGGTGLGEGMKRVNLLGTPGEILGHGLLDQNGRPIHLTLFSR